MISKSSLCQQADVSVCDCWPHFDWRQSASRCLTISRVYVTQEEGRTEPFSAMETGINVCPTFPLAVLVFVFVPKKGSAVPYSLTVKSKYVHLLAEVVVFHCSCRIVGKETPPERELNPQSAAGRFAG